MLVVTIPWSLDVTILISQAAVQGTTGQSTQSSSDFLIKFGAKHLLEIYSVSNLVTFKTHATVSPLVAGVMEALTSLEVDNHMSLSAFGSNPNLFRMPLSQSGITCLTCLSCKLLVSPSSGKRDLVIVMAPSDLTQSRIRCHWWGLDVGVTHGSKYTPYYILPIAARCSVPRQLDRQLGSYTPQTKAAD